MKLLVHLDDNHAILVQQKIGVLLEILAEGIVVRKDAATGVCSFIPDGKDKDPERDPMSYVQVLPESAPSLVPLREVSDKINERTRRVPEGISAIICSMAGHDHSSDNDDDDDEPKA